MHHTPKLDGTVPLPTVTFVTPVFIGRTSKYAVSPIVYAGVPRTCNVIPFAVTATVPGAVVAIPATD